MAILVSLALEQDAVSQVAGALQPHEHLVDMLRRTVGRHSVSVRCEWKS